MAVVECKKDLGKTFDELIDKFKKENINGSIELHFAAGTLAKIHERRAYG